MLVRWMVAEVRVFLSAAVVVAEGGKVMMMVVVVGERRWQRRQVTIDVQQMAASEVWVGMLDNVVVVAQRQFLRLVTS